MGVQIQLGGVDSQAWAWLQRSTKGERLGLNTTLKRSGEE